MSRFLVGDFLFDDCGVVFSIYPSCLNIAAATIAIEIMKYLNLYRRGAVGSVVCALSGRKNGSDLKLLHFSTKLVLFRRKFAVSLYVGLTLLWCLIYFRLFSFVRLCESADVK